MGTRADFYIKDHHIMTWLGSVAYDAYPDGVDSAVLKAKNRNRFQTAVLDFFHDRDDEATYAIEGWPWPWEDSNTTDYAYVFDVQKKQTFISCFGTPYYTLKDSQRFDTAYERWYKKQDENADVDKYPEPDFDKFLVKIKRTKKFNFPNMKAIQNIKLEGSASGLIVIKDKAGY